MPVIRREQVAPCAVAVGVALCRAADLFALDVARGVIGVDIARAADRRRGKLPLPVIAVGRYGHRGDIRSVDGRAVPDLCQAAALIVEAIVAAHQLSRRVSVIDVVRQGTLAAVIIIAEVVRPYHDAADGLASQLIRSLICIRHGDARALNIGVEACQQPRSRAVRIGHGRRAAGVIPRLFRQAVGRIVYMLGALLKRAAVILAAADQATEAVVFVVIFLACRRALLCKPTGRIVGIFICDIIILFRRSNCISYQLPCLELFLLFLRFLFFAGIIIS